jgi:AcrR family transcriptional regulator
MGVKERREREREHRRTQIQQAAKHLFMTKGFANATVEEIADRAELSAGTIYTYFRSKEELLASLILIPLKYLFEGIQKIYESELLTAEEKILAFKEVMFDTFEYDPLMMRNIFHLQVEDTLETLSLDLLAEIQQMTRKITNMLVDVYREGVEKGEFVNGSSVAHVDIMWATFSGLVMWEEAKRKLNPSKDYLKPTLDLAFQIMLNGIKKR